MSIDDYTEHKGPAHPKIFGLGIGRTGTLSLSKAVEKLGFGPSFHPLSIDVNTGYWHKFVKAMKGGGSPDLLDDIYHGYGSAFDIPTAILAEPLYKAYPDAKYILTVRDINKWVESMKRVILPMMAETNRRNARIASGTATEDDLLLDKVLVELGLSEWTLMCNSEYFENRMLTHPEEQYLKHNERVMKLIPPEKLLVFDVEEGWEPLVNFLGVPKPNEPFPRVNDSEAFLKTMSEWARSINNINDKNFAK